MEPITPTATVTLPDLVIGSVYITLETGDSCDFSSTTLGIRVTVANNGSTASGPFVVDVNGSQQSMPDLAAGQSVSLWFTGYLFGSNTVTIYVNGDVVDQKSAPLPIPTLPPTCTPTATPTATSTPTVTNTPTATATVTTGRCLTFGQKVELTIGILKRLGARAGQRRYKAKYDVNGDGAIDARDLVQVANTPTCHRHHDDDDDQHRRHDSRDD